MKPHDYDVIRSVLTRILEGLGIKPIRFYLWQGRARGNDYGDIDIYIEAWDNGAIDFADLDQINRAARETYPEQGYMWWLADMLIDARIGRGPPNEPPFIDFGDLYTPPTPQNVNDGHFHRCKWLVDNAGPGPILDVGCADNWLIPRNENVAHLDLWKPTHEVLEKRRGDFGKYVTGDAHAPPFKENGFETILAGDVLEHLHHPVEALKAWRRLGPRLVLTVPWEEKWEPQCGPYTNSGHLSYFNPTSLAENLIMGGWEPNIGVIEGGGWWFMCSESVRREYSREAFLMSK